MKPHDILSRRAGRRPTAIHQSNLNRNWSNPKPTIDWSDNLLITISARNMANYRPDARAYGSGSQSRFVRGRKYKECPFSSTHTHQRINGGQFHGPRAITTLIFHAPQWTGLGGGMVRGGVGKIIIPIETEKNWVRTSGKKIRKHKSLNKQRGTTLTITQEGKMMNIFTTRWMKRGEG